MFLIRRWEKNTDHSGRSKRSAVRRSHAQRYATDATPIADATDAPAPPTHVTDATDAPAPGTGDASDAPASDAPAADAAPAPVTPPAGPRYRLTDTAPDGFKPSRGLSAALLAEVEADGYLTATEYADRLLANGVRFK